MSKAHRPFSTARQARRGDRTSARHVLHRAIVAIDALEPRRLLAATLDSGILTVDGTGGSDDIRINLDDDEIVIRLNGEEDGEFDADEVQAIRVFAGDGDEI